MTDLTPVRQTAGTIAEGGADLEAEFLASLDAAAAEHVAGQRPKKTRESYARDWTLWREHLDWLAAQPQSRGVRVSDLSVRSGTLVTFVQWLDTVQRAAPATIGRRVTGVITEARSRGAVVTKTETEGARTLVRQWMRDPVRVARGRGQAAALTLPDLRRMVTAELPGAHPVSVLRDRAMTLIAFYVAARAAETAALVADRVSVDRSGNLIVAVPAVKGGDGRTVGIERMQDPEVCPVRAWQAWTSAAGIETGPAFQALTRAGNPSGKAMAPDSVTRALARMAERAGVEYRVTGHSLRSGFVTEGRRAGVPAEKLRAQTGHSAASPVFWVYVRQGELFEESVTGRMEA
ncbi:tyrosine-type recombinase/integrase [Streptomyces hydrogenans]